MSALARYALTLRISLNVAVLFSMDWVSDQLSLAVSVLARRTRRLMARHYRLTEPEKQRTFTTKTGL